MKEKIELPVPVLDNPHWRVNFRLAEYKEQLVPSLGNCFEIIEKNKLSLRGWDYPHLSRRDADRGYGKNWIASWSDFLGHYEYWRFYQSGQFLHLFSVREATETEWRKKLEAEMRSHLSSMSDIDWETVPGFISIVNFTYNVTEIYEFAARLCQSQVYQGPINIKIELRGIKGFVLSAPWKRAWYSYYAASEDILERTADYESDDLVASSKEAALESIVWFFERFGWLNPTPSVISNDQENLIKGRY
ncbi:MAG: hypothetical protein HQL10_12370 [Nitrospirae bacterium]|nr:hypothetical protein [Nitrospirota bacterium]